MITGYDELVAAGTSTRQAARLTGLSRATQDRRVHTRLAGLLGRRDAVPVNKLTALEQEQVLAVLNEQRFVDKPPMQIFAVLLAEGDYLCSISTMYGILAEHAQVKDRRRRATHPPRAVPELQATGPRQVYSWGIAKLAGPVRGKYFDCYVMIDIYSRMIVGAHVHHTETAELAVDLMTEVFGVQGVPKGVHADRGTSMTSKSVAMLLDDLQVTRSHSRPRVSNDNPFSPGVEQDAEACAGVPGKVHLAARGRQFIDQFVEYYNHDHRHSGIGLHTPADAHYGLAPATAQLRSQALAAARAQHPTRFATDRDPKILHLPAAAWSNEPKEGDTAA